MLAEVSISCYLRKSELFTARKLILNRKFISPLVGLILCSLLVSSISIARAASVTDCFAIKSSGFERGIFGEKSYVIEFYSLCSMSTVTEISRFNNTGLTFTASGPQKISSFVSIYNFNNYKTFTFKLGDAKSGDYRVQIDLWARSDDSKRTIYLPNFRIEDPVECIKEVSTKAENTPLRDTKIMVKLRNGCSSIPNKDFSYSSISLYLSISGRIPTEKQKIDTLSGIESSFEFYVAELDPGTYYPKLVVEGYPIGKTLQLSSFVINPKSTPSSTPRAEASVADDLQLCSFSKNISENCTWAPEWFFEFCTVYEASQLQQKVGNKWVKRKDFKAELKSDSCDKTNPNFFTVSGTSTSKSTLQFRMSHKATKKYIPSLYYFTVKPKISR
jgi:hypothetical protein